MSRTFFALAIAAALAVWAVPASAEDVGAPPPPSAMGVADCCPPVVCCRPGWAATGGVLFAKIRRSDTVYGVVDTDGAPPLGDGDDALEVEFDYELGFRAGLRYTFCGECCWDVGVSGTFLSADADDSRTVTPPALIIPRGGVFGTATSASASYDEDYLVVDLDVGYTFGGRCLCVRAFAGLRYVSIEEDVDREFAGVGGVGAPEPQGLPFVSTVDENTDMDAIGIHGGVEPRWNVCGGFSVFGRLGGGVLLASFDWTHQESATGIPVTPVDVAKSIDTDITMIEAALGVSWESQGLWCGRLGVRVSAGYEFVRYDFLDFSTSFPFSLVPDVQDSSFGVDGFFLTVDVLF